MPIISLSVVKHPRKMRRCDNCLKYIDGETIRIYGMAEIGDKPYDLFLHRSCLVSRDAIARLRAVEHRDEAVEAGQGGTSHTEDDVVTVGRVQDERHTWL